MLVVQAQPSILTVVMVRHRLFLPLLPQVVVVVEGGQILDLTDKLEDQVVVVMRQQLAAQVILQPHLLMVVMAHPPLQAKVTVVVMVALAL